MTNNHVWTGPTKAAEGMPEELRWLAEVCDEWPEHEKAVNVTIVGPRVASFDWRDDGDWNKSQYLQARKDLGLVMSDEEEEMPAEEHRNKYMREIKPGVWVDVYDVLNAWVVQNPALQHLIKKALQPGERGHKTMEQDMNDIVASALRARELEQ